MQSKDVVHVLYYMLNEDRDNEVHRTIGIYSSREQVLSAISRLKVLEGFTHPNGEFQIHESVIDRDGWTEGFGSGDPY